MCMHVYRYVIYVCGLYTIYVHLEGGEALEVVHRDDDRVDQPRAEELERLVLEDEDHHLVLVLPVSEEEVDGEDDDRHGRRVQLEQQQPDVDGVLQPHEERLVGGDLRVEEDGAEARFVEGSWKVVEGSATCE